MFGIIQLIWDSLSEKRRDKIRKVIKQLDRVTWMCHICEINPSTRRCLVGRCKNPICEECNVNGYCLACMPTSELNELCKVCETTLPEKNNIRVHRPRLKTGYDNSHIEPISEYGEGETIPEPSALNRSRGNRESLV